MKLLGSIEGKITEDKYSKNVTKLGITDVVHCNIVNNQNQYDSRVLSTIVPNKLFGQLLNISTTNRTYVETFHSEFP